MKFTLIKDIKKDSEMSIILRGLLMFILLYLIADIFVMSSNFGITSHTLNTTLFGDEDEYIDPIGSSAFLEFWHTQIFFIMMVLLTLNSIFIRLAKEYKILITNIVMMSAILSLVCLPLSFYFSAVFVDLYIVSYFTWHITALYMVADSLWRLNAKSV
ncbi:hypothetical protein N9A28_00485 [Sulfurimonas sp.]|nr:hypothetical protein [Sulfurimonas sp.]